MKRTCVDCSVISTKRWGILWGVVREDERAASLDGSEENDFAWGAELRLHRAAVPAIEVFSKVSK